MTMTYELSHESVLLQESIEALDIQRGGRYIDCTVNGGGHAAAIIEESSPGGRLLGIDADPLAVRIARERFKDYGSDVTLVNENFKYLESIADRFNFRPVNGIIFDLGMSSLQLEDTGRGFSFQHDAPLDMRFSPRQAVTAAEVVNEWPEESLARVLVDYGEEWRGKRVARAVVENRPINTTLELAGLVQRVVGGGQTRIHPATKTFQALRIAVNEELENLDSALRQAVSLLGSGGRLVVISFHSLEDRLVKTFLRRESQGCLCPPEVTECRCGHQQSLKLMSKKAIRPGPDEIESNPRSRSARLRVAERI